MINTITVTGRCVKNPEVKSVKVSKKEQKSVARVTLAVNKNEDTTFFFPVVAWGALAEAIEKYVNKGNKITVSGYLAYEEWKDDKGKWHSRIYINAQSIEFMTMAEKSKGDITKRTKSKQDDDEAFYYARDILHKACQK